jgi:BlaI family penicillinase repressor
MLLLQHTTMPKQPHVTLSRRERQIMDILYQRGKATAAEIHEALPDAPTYSAVRAKLRVLEEKGHIRHQAQDLRYVFLATLPREKAKQSALRHLLDTFFEGSAEQAVAALLDSSSTQLSNEELDRLSKLIEDAKSAGA